MKISRSRQGIVIIILLALLADLGSAAALENTRGAYGRVSIPDLIEKASLYDGERIEVVGEVIGDKLERPNGVWMTVLADGVALGVFSSYGDASAIDALGSYASSGDQVSVQGVFHRVCPEHGGDLDLHAQHVAKLASGKATPHAIEPVRAFWGMALCAVGTVLAALWRLRERRKAIG